MTNEDKKEKVPLDEQCVLCSNRKRDDSEYCDWCLSKHNPNWDKEEEDEKEED